MVLGVSGGIAAYKAAEIVRLLTDAGARVRVMMTPAAERFIAPLTLSVLSGSPAISDLWDPASGAVDHIELARWAQILAVAPATADSLAKLARGVADDVLSTYALAHRGALVLAPAMNTWMWSHPATLENVASLRARGAEIVEPDDGELACGDFGPGRLAAPARIVHAILDAGRRSRELEGRRLLVTAGPTREPIDPVRFLSNRSSGRMGFALAREAARRGAEVILVTGPTALATPAGVTLVRVVRTEEMRDEVLKHLPGVEALLMAAAPADFVAASPAPRKLKRTGSLPDLKLALAPDILKAVRGVRRPEQVVVAFAAETEDLLQGARKKLEDKGVDLLVANDVSHAGTGFETEDNEVIILAGPPDTLGPTAEREELVERSSKLLIAGRILDRVSTVLERRCPRNVS